MKKVTIKTSTQKPQIDVDSWVGVKTNPKQLNVDIPHDLHYKLKSKAAIDKKTIKDIILSAIKEYCEDRQ